MPRLVINLSRETVSAQEGEAVWTAAEAVSRLRGASALSQIARHTDVRLVVDDIRAITSARPLLAARALALGRAEISDLCGRVDEIGWARAAQIGASAAAAAADWPRRRARLRSRLDQTAGPQQTFGPGEGVLAVRGDLWFGIRAGGAVAHTAGVLNELARVAGPVRLLAPAPMPLLDPAIEIRVVTRSQLWSPSGPVAAAAFNDDLLAAARAVPAPAFVYARNSVLSTAALQIARRFRTPFVVEYNGPEAWVARHWGEPLPEADLAAEFEAQVLRKADLVSVVSAPLRDLAVDLGVSPERVLISPNAVDVDRYRPDLDGSLVRARYGLGAGLVIGFIGTFGAWHGAELLAEAAVRLKGRARLLMIGDGPRAAAARTAAAQLGPDAVFTGLINQEDGAAYLAACDILVSPTLPNPDGSRFFGSPTKLFEYMAMGRAIVASRLEQIGDVLADGETAALVTPGDLASLTAALSKLLDDGALRARLGANARVAAVSRHTWRARVAELMARVGDLRAARPRS